MTPTHVSGAFLYWQKEMLADGPAEWEARLAFLRDLGMDTIITQFSVIREKAWYASAHLELASAESDPTGQLLAAAQRVGFRVHLGTATDERWWEVHSHPEQIPGYVAEESARNHRIIRELAELYRGHPALAGIYLSHEIHLGQEGQQIKRENLSALADFCNRIAQEAKRSAPELILSNAPFFSLRGTVEEFEAMWRDLLGETHFDLMMLQDGVGCERHITVENMVSYYAAMQRACEATGVELWTDLELFDLNPPKTVSAERLAAQLAGEAPYVSKVVAYSYANLREEGFVGKLPRLG
jgi:hypothetical protein